MGTTNDSAILTVAARSAGVCTRSELLAAGLPPTTISARVRSGFMERAGAGVYQVPALVTAATPLYRAARAYPRGGISHHSAALAWGFPIPPARPGLDVEVTVPRPAGSRPRVVGVSVHEARRLTPDELAEPMPGLPATSPARTVIDLAGSSLLGHRLRHIVQTQVVVGQFTLEDIGHCLDRVGGRGVAGSGRLRRLLLDLGGGPIPQSELERRLGRLLDQRFNRQFRPPWYGGSRGVVDFAEPHSRTIVEADGRRWHATEQAMIEDRRRDRLAAANGWLVVRVTWADVVDRPEATVADIDATVARRSSSVA